MSKGESPSGLPLFELPEPIHIDRIGYDSSHAYTEAQMRAAIAAAYEAGYARAIKMVAEGE